MSKTLVVVFLGPPGSGKGTQGKELAKSFAGLQHVATGDLFRAEIARKSETGLAVEETIRAGKLVSDDLTYAVLKSQLIKIVDEKKPEILILDGYPRNGSQADSLKKLLTQLEDRLEGPVYFELVVPKEVIVERISGRLVNPRSGVVYHLKQRPPRVPFKCDEDGGELVQRPDDKPEVVGGRFDVYEKGLKEILGRIQSEAFKHFRFDGTLSVEKISNELSVTLKQLKSLRPSLG